MVEDGGPAWGSASGTATLSTIPRTSKVSLSSTNFNIGSSIAINTNRASSSFTHKAVIAFNGSTVRTQTGIGASYSWNTTELYPYITNKNKATGTVTLTTYSGSTVIGTSSVSFTANITNSNPIFSNCEWEDIKAESLELTGNNQIFINGYNNLKVIISTVNKAAAKNSATMSKYRLVCGNQSVEASYSSTADVVLNLVNITNMTFTLYAIDSRGNSTAITKSVAEWKNYSNPVITNGTAVRTDGVSTETTLSFNGTFWKTEEQLDFGAVANEIVTCNYKYKKSNESNYGSEINITPTINGGNFSFNATILGDEGAEGFELQNSYNIQITIIDKIRTITYDVLLGSGSPVMAIHRDGVAFGQPYDENEGGHLQLDGARIIESGTDSSNYNGYIKYADGTMICYGRKYITATIGNTWGNIYSSGDFDPDIQFMKTFHRIISCNANYIYHSYTAWLGDISYNASKIGTIQLFRGTAAPSSTYCIAYQVFGTWK